MMSADRGNDLPHPPADGSHRIVDGMSAVPLAG